MSLEKATVLTLASETEGSVDSHFADTERRLRFTEQNVPDYSTVEGFDLLILGFKDLLHTVGAHRGLLSSLGSLLVGRKVTGR